jgi:hypothetical protein
MKFIHYIITLLYIVAFSIRYGTPFLRCSIVLNRYRIPAYRSHSMNITIWRLGKNNIDKLGRGYDFPC